MKNFRFTLSLVLIGLIAVFAIQNAAELQVHFLFWSITTRRVFVLFGVLAIGFFLGWLMRSFADGRHKENIEKS